MTHVDAEFVKSIISGQFCAARAMLGECIEKCAAEHWDGLIVKHPSWQVAYHTLLRRSASFAG